MEENIKLCFMEGDPSLQLDYHLRGTRGTRETVALLLATLHRAPLFDSRRRARSDDTTFDVDGEVSEPQSGAGDSTHRTVPSVGQLACVLHSLLCACTRPLASRLCGCTGGPPSISLEPGVEVEAIISAYM